MSKKGTVFGETRIHLLENPGFFRLGERERERAQKYKSPMNGT